MLGYHMLQQELTSSASTSERIVGTEFLVRAAMRLEALFHAANAHALSRKLEEKEGGGGLKDAACDDLEQQPGLALGICEALMFDHLLRDAGPWFNSR